MTMFLENTLGSGGHTNRLIWFAPDPPQGHILYYNARINSTGNGEVLVPFVTEIYANELSLRPYTSIDGEYSVEVYKIIHTVCVSVYKHVTACTTHSVLCMWRSILCVHVSLYSFQVQAVTSVGAGNFSVPVLVQRSTDNTNSTDVTTTDDGLIVKHVLYALFPSLAIIVVTLTAIFVVLYYLR